MSVDDDYLLVSTHLDELTRQKICGHKYMDFSKLLRKDRPEDDNKKMVMVNKGGYSYWVLAEDRGMSVINNYGTWDQAFRVYLHVYTTNIQVEQQS